MPVHPRARGEHIFEGKSSGRPSGSSPRARGTPAALALPERAGRFIPARAGNTLRAQQRSRLASVHPRARGEHNVFNWARETGYGSSPRARGTLGPPRWWNPPYRFIPARAGNTTSSSARVASYSVHPRARGEHRLAPRGLREFVGSSPRARGTQVTHAAVGEQERFIPARAGNTPSRVISLIPPTVHPRARGEHASPRVISGISGGSSPRARGTPQHI